MSLAIIVAVASNGVIGRAGQLPWHLPEDLRRFRALTMGHPIIMGARTHHSIGRVLPGRANIVVTSHPAAVLEGARAVASLSEALAAAGDDPLPFVIGGARLYAEALPLATHLYLTRVEREVDGDVHFPPIDWSRWTVVRREPAQTPGVELVDALART